MPSASVRDTILRQWHLLGHLPRGPRGYGSRSRSRRKTLVLNPLALLQRGLVSYLVATCPPHEDVRLFALHRVRTARALRTPTVPVDGFSLDDFLARGFADFGKGARVTLRLLAAPSVATHLRECRLSEDQEVQAVPEPAGWSLVEATVNETPQLVWWLRGFGADVLVLEPNLTSAVSHQADVAATAARPGR